MEPLGGFDCILMRKDPPFDTEYIYTTYILERAEEQGALVVNRPQGLRDINEKVYTAWFPQCCAPTLITRDMADMDAFLREHGKIVCKPLHGMGGRSIFVLEQHDKNMTRGVRDAHRLRPALRHRAALPAARSWTRATRGCCSSTGSRCPTPWRAFRSRTTTAATWRPGARGVGRPLEERDRWLAGADRAGPRSQRACCSSASM